MNRQVIKMLRSISTGMVVLAVLFAFLISGIRIFGIEVYGVLTGSMEPTYPTGSLIYVKSVDANELRVNDVITFSLTPGVIATHRIVEVVPDESNPSILRFRTKGDANNDVDASLVSAGNIVGKVMFAVPQLGYLASYIQQPPGLYVAIFVCGLMIAFVFYTDSLESKSKKSGRRPASKQGIDLARIINAISQKLIGRPLISKKRIRKQREDDSFYAGSGYRPPRASRSVSTTQTTPSFSAAQRQQTYTESQYIPQHEPYYPQQPYPQQGYQQYDQQGQYGQYPQQYSYPQGYPPQKQYYPQQQQYYVPQYQPQGYSQKRSAQGYQLPYSSPYDQGDVQPEQCRQSAYPQQQVSYQHAYPHTKVNQREPRSSRNHPQ